MTTDALERLSRCRAALRHARIATADAYELATPEQLELLGDCRPYVERCLEESRPPVLAALFADAGVVDWTVAQSQASADERLLTLRYRAGSDGERRAWAALIAATA